MPNVQELFGSMVFNQKVMRELLPKDTFKALKKTLDDGTPLELEIANQVAHAMKEWAISKGATHYTHWFQPLTGITAEKHESFIAPDKNGGVIMEFGGKELVKGESDASSFPSGGSRATFEARGYTVWDPTAYAFVKDHSLCIPTAFCSYTGEALDKKTPLLRSIEALSKQAVRVLRLFGEKNVEHVISCVGAEQEYFLIDEKLYEKRRDLQMTGRTLFGAKPAKGQEMDDQYFTAITPRVTEYMEDLNEELWKLGIFAKTEHNETAPAQHEMAPIFSTTNLAADQNQLTMEIMKKVARRHGLVCLLHEKPFAGINGSGKHNNWSIETDSGEGLLKPGDTPRENARFLLFLTAVIRAVDDNQDLLRISVASAGNDHRLGANEAPPAIMSIFVGDELEAVLKSIKDGTPYSAKSKQKIKIGADVLPPIPKDTTDRNRTSPFAFTVNKFEFRSVGSSLSISGPMTTLNAIVADVLKEYADKLEGAKDFNQALQELIKKEITDHWKIIFNGNGYGDDWVSEAKKRGLLNLRNLPEAVAEYLKPKNVKLYTETGIYTEAEMKSHYEVKLEKYCQVLNIEVGTMLEMVNKNIMPSVLGYMDSIAETVVSVKNALPLAKCGAGISLLEKLDELADSLSAETASLFEKHAEAIANGDYMLRAKAYAEKVIPAMEKVRAVTDAIEPLLAESYKPFPSYEELLFSV
ncbi:glutamine synthetase III [Treponema sp. Marseille-Q4130]|uniref:glutamine synthetase III family protein n=1 Tax=Treponema sp. Marseille-Q4130 TaxID=2766702 RepID=UPI001652503D|nr:glutamine synthetase III [Treponema sp. Marseille-Q4130]MBC6721103.1 glutamine synthetase III [Treponema sp. Marseille-Q4130]